MIKSTRFWSSAKVNTPSTPYILWKCHPQSSLAPGTQCMTWQSCYILAGASQTSAWKRWNFDSFSSLPRCRWECEGAKKWCKSIIWWTGQARWDKLSPSSKCINWCVSILPILNFWHFLATVLHTSVSFCYRWLLQWATCFLEANKNTFISIQL